MKDPQSYAVELAKAHRRWRRPDYVPCPDRSRHWFSKYGAPGWRMPTCQACGAPNPNWDHENPDR